MASATLQSYSGSTLSDVLQALGYSELIEKFEGETFTDIADLLTDTERVKKLVPEQQLDDFKLKVDQFFDKNNSKEDNDDEDDVTVFSEEEDEEVADENIAQNNQIDSIYSTENVDVKKILEDNFEGNQILQWHNSKSYLKSGQRNRIVHIVTAAVLNICKRRLGSKDFEILSRKIVEVFPKECQIVYYILSVPRTKSETGRKKNPKGKLPNKYSNLKKLMVSYDKCAKLQEPVDDTSDVETTIEIQESLDWLKSQEEPWEETKQHWKITANYRRVQIENEYKNKISSIYEEYVILKTAKGYELIVDDFAFFKFCGNPKAIDEFKLFFNKASQVKPLRKDDYCDMLKNMLENDELKEDDGILVRLMLLSIMLPSTARIRVGPKQKWKPSTVESLEGIVTRVKIYGDIEKVKTERHQNAQSRNLTVQPYIIVVEEKDYDVRSVYLCIDDIVYAIPSLLEALDVCFKSFHVFNARYTEQSEHIWLMLQIGLYKFRTKWDSRLINVTEILNDMGCLLPELSESKKKQSKKRKTKK